MKYFYKITGGIVDIKVSTTPIDGYIEYVVGEEPKEVLDILLLDIEKTDKIKAAIDYLNSTDFYYTRQLETGEPVSENIVAQRTEYREYLRANDY